MTYLYVVGRPEGPVKVGITDYLEARVRQIQTGCHFKLSLLFSREFEKREDARFHEKRFHGNFDLERLHGEWFDLDAERAVGCIL